MTKVKTKLATKNATKGGYGNDIKKISSFSDLVAFRSKITSIQTMYEFWCISKLLNELSRSYKIEIKKNGHKVFSLALGPSKKASNSYFLMSDKTTNKPSFQFCTGSEIKLTYAPDTTISPDISIQKYNASLTPNENAVFYILDAKHTSNSSSKKFDIERLHSFIQRSKALNCHKSIKPIKCDLIGNHILTNLVPSIKHEEYCKKNKIKQIGNFDLGKTHKIVG